MTPEREPVDDAALIVEAIKNTGKSMSCWRDEIELVAREAVRLARTGWQPPAPEPDRAELLAKELWENGSGPSLKDWETIIRRHFAELRAEWEAEREDAVALSVYDSAVKGRQDFRNAYRKLLPVLRAAEALSAKWRAKGQKVDSTDFFDAINAVDVAVTGGGATPIPFADLPEAERPVIDVPEEVIEAAKRIQRFNRDSPGLQILTDFILQLAKGPSQ